MKLGQKWLIEYYLTSSGRLPIEELIDSLPHKTRARVYNTLELLAEFGIRLGMPHAKKVTGTPFWELRVLGEKSLRFFYVTRVSRSFLLLHGFTKKQQKTPKKEIKIVKERLGTFRIALDNITKL